MNIYLLKAHDRNRGYDLHQGFVVVAKSPGQARRIACSEYFNGEPFDEPTQRDKDERKFWSDAKTSACSCVGIYRGPEMAPHVLLADYRAG